MVNSINNNSHNFIVDIIRFIAASLVIFSHCFSLSMKNSCDYIACWINGVSFGAVSVSVFFCISGYFITSSLIKKGDNKFIVKRLKKILPELIIVVLLSVFIIGPIFTNLSLTAYFSKLSTYLYLLNGIMIPVHNLPGVFSNNVYGATLNGALWTLMVEFLCYVFVWIIYRLKLLKKDKIVIVYLCTLFLSIIAHYILLELKLDLFIAMIRPFLVFMFSSLLYLNADSITNNKFFVLLLFIPLILIFYPSLFIFNGVLVFILPIAIIKLINIKIKLNSKLLILMGNISYPMYLVGFIVQQCIVDIFGGTMDPYLNFIISLPLSIVFGYFIYIINKVCILRRLENVI